MRLRYSLLDVPIFLLAIAFLIPFLVHLAEIVIDFITSTEF